MGTFRKGIIGLTLAALLAGCTCNKQYRDAYEPCTTAQKGPECSKSSIEQTNEYLLGFVEFDDQGWFWDRKQADVLIDRLLAKDVLESGLLMVVYVHGWQHNASFDDDNVQSFRETLKRIHAYEQLASQSEKRAARRVAGIYVGWRGLSLKPGLLKYLTFWDRKNTADKVGHGALTDLMSRLETVQASHLKVYDADKSRLAQTKLIVVGHSFGGQVVYSALSQILVDRFTGGIDAMAPKTFGDLVILVNPAFEASRFTTLHDLAGVRTWYADGQLPLVAIFTSETDLATKTAFPAGRNLSTIFEKYRDGEQKKADRQTVGHFEPYRTHELRPRPDVEARAPLALETDQQKAADFRTVTSLRQQWIDLSSRSGWNLDLGGARLTHQGKTVPRNPLYVVAVDKGIIDGHSDIWNPRFLDFLRQFILFTTIVKE